MMKCTVCGADLNEGQSYCSYCGTKVEEQVSDQTVAEEVFQEQNTDVSDVNQPVLTEETAVPFEDSISPAPTNTEAVDKSALLGMIFGIISFTLCCIGLPTGIIGIVNSAKGLRSTSRKAMAIVGLILSILSVVLFFNFWSGFLVGFLESFFNQSVPSGGIDLSVFSYMFR